MKICYILSPKTNAWKAKCPIFEAKVAGFRGKVAQKKIGHLAFQVGDFLPPEH